MADISVIGSGSWGTALAWLLRNNGHRVTLWSYLREENEMFLKYRENVDKLPGVLLDQEVVFTNQLEESIPGETCWYWRCLRRRFAVQPAICGGWYPKDSLS